MRQSLQVFYCSRWRANGKNDLELWTANWFKTESPEPVIQGLRTSGTCPISYGSTGERPITSINGTASPSRFFQTPMIQVLFSDHEVKPAFIAASR